MLPKDERIKSAQEIKEIIKRRRIQFSSPLLCVIAQENKKEKPRIVVNCSRRIGGAVVRNKVKRRINAAYTKIKHKIRKNLDIVVIPKMYEKRKGAIEKELSEALTDKIY